MSALLSLQFWFNQHPVAMSPSFSLGFFVFFALFAITAASLRIIAKRTLRDVYDKQAFRMAGNMAAWLTFFGFIWLFCTYEEVQIFGVRAWFILWALILLGCAIRIAVFVRKEAPALRLQNASRSTVNQYLPRRAR
jgi:hypothetical protein